MPTYSVVMAHVNDAVGEGEFVAAFRWAADRAGCWRGGWAYSCGACHVGLATRPVTYAHCRADPHGRFWGVSADTPSSPACDAQRNFRGRAAYPSCDHARVGTFERWFTQQNSVVSCEPSGNADRSQMVREKFRSRAAPVRMMSSAVRCPKVP